ncbi:hypothetical protein LSTR_LSTR015253 [Laodelphax striatellus]|uniref:Uncharacterized protein n=1 Tax=Laodelphax striatellus TaxID=195883 RepID=A0A482XGN5_LAOST|nr:hypothetical protein LSTR_LSTR015253 [Laodelphax striatellus]
MRRRKETKRRGKRVKGEEEKGKPDIERLTEDGLRGQVGQPVGRTADTTGDARVPTLRPVMAGNFVSAKTPPLRIAPAVCAQDEKTKKKEKQQKKKEKKPRGFC